MRANDLELTVDSRWAGCRNGGYYPLRIRAANKSKDRVVTIEYYSEIEPPIPTVRRTISIAQNATARLTLPVPCVGAGTYGSLRVIETGRVIKDLTRQLSLPEMEYDKTRPALLVISPSSVDVAAFETAVTSSVVAAPSSPYGGYMGTTYENHEVIEPSMLPESWIDYSGLDIVALSLSELGKLSNDERAAILKWVHCGGTLVVYNVAKPADESDDLTRLLELNKHASVDEAWTPANLKRRQKINIVKTDQWGNVIQGDTQVSVNGYVLNIDELDQSVSSGIITQEQADEVREERSKAITETFTWSEDEQVFVSRRLMLGNVFAFQDDPFPGSPHDWGWFLKSIPKDQQTWTRRHGISGRMGSKEFLNFLIPSVRGIPVLAFLLLITLFTICIGPLNYLWLWKKKHLYLLVVTIPVFAFVTSLALFAYSAVAHGFGTKSRARTMTFIDQKSNTAVSVSRIALFAGLAPGGGLRFTPETAVFPIWPNKTGFDWGTVDWTEQQHLTSGWLRSRTRTQFLTMSHRDERGRLTVTPKGDDKLNVTNGLEWGLQSLIVMDESGQAFYGENIPAGASTELAVMTAEQKKLFVASANSFPMNPPKVGRRSGDMFEWDFDPYYGYGRSVTASYKTNMAETQWESLKNSRGNDGLQPSTYAAVVSESPGIEMGVEKTRPQASIHMLFGWY
ncbi:MAG: hypothetical protein KDA93_08980 [Planctomycetaceae bacterium]|nr:hypothetical protein [Planctomycetaceae bacterium]